MDTNKIDAVLSGVIGILAYIFGDFWGLFIFFLALNVADYFTGTIKARFTKTENSNDGAKGIAKKVGYWIVIAIAFIVPEQLIPLGNQWGVHLDILSAIGWLTLAAYIMNEIRSILENLTLVGVKIPAVLTKGLEVIGKQLDEESEKGLGGSGGGLQDHNGEAVVRSVPPVESEDKDNGSSDN
jgi:toxin secretion/phage lysis holin